MTSLTYQILKEKYDKENKKNYKLSTLTPTKSSNYIGLAATKLNQISPKTHEDIMGKYTGNAKTALLNNVGDDFTLNYLMSGEDKKKAETVVNIARRLDASSSGLGKKFIESGTTAYVAGKDLSDRASNMIRITPEADEAKRNLFSEYGGKRKRKTKKYIKKQNKKKTQKQKKRRIKKEN
jgi:hypothetical protein